MLIVPLCHAQIVKLWSLYQTLLDQDPVYIENKSIYEMYI